MLSLTRKPALNYATAVRRRPSLDFSLTGLVFCGIMMFMGLAAVNSQANLLFGVFGLMIGVLLVSVSVSRMVLKKLMVQRVLPEHAVVGQPMVLTYECSNQKRYWPSLSVTVSELDGGEAFTRQPLAYMLHAAPGTTAVIGTELIPKRRGLHSLDRHQVGTSFPFGFIKRAAERRHAETLLVYPAIGTVDPKLLSLCRAAENTGSSLRPRRGGNDEFYGLKEYRTGENPRHIYWRRTARTGVLVSKEMTMVAPPRLLILVDTFLRERTAAGHEQIERGIAMAASLATYALEAGLMVGLYAWKGEWHGISPNRGKRHSRDLLAALARLPLNTEHGPDALVEKSRSILKSGTTPILITPGNSDSLDSGRGSMVQIPIDSDKARAWFHFDSSIDFSHAMPIDQQLKEEGSGERFRGSGKKKPVGPVEAPAVAAPASTETSKGSPP